MDAAALRAAFPILAQRAYLNAGTCGPLPTAAVRASARVLEQSATGGRGSEHFKAMFEMRARLRGRYAEVLGAAAEDVALTTCTSEGVARVIAALDLRAGDEVLTSDQEHPGVLGPLGAARRLRGVSIRVAPFAELAGAVSPATKLVATSHVSWVSGRVVPDLSDAGAPVLLDGAQGVGAVPISVTALGCAFYAGSGQKWLCGPIGTGMLWVSPDWGERLPAPGPAYLNLADPDDGLDAAPHPTAARHDAPAQALEATAAAEASLGVLGDAGWDAVYERAASLAERLAGALAERGREVAPRGRTTLVSWREREPAATRDALADGGVMIRDLPGRGLLRASVGAWNDESDLDRLLSALP